MGWGLKFRFTTKTTFIKPLKKLLAKPRVNIKRLANKYIFMFF